MSSPMKLFITVLLFVAIAAVGIVVVGKVSGSMNNVSDSVVNQLDENGGEKDVYNTIMNGKGSGSTN